MVSLTKNYQPLIGINNGNNRNRKINSHAKNWNSVHSISYRDYNCNGRVYYHKKEMIIVFQLFYDNIFFYESKFYF